MNYSIDFIFEMYAHYGDLLHKQRNADPARLAFWRASQQFYMDRFEKLVPFNLIASQLNIAPKTEP